MPRKQNLASALGIPKEKLGVTMHFSEIIKLQFRKNYHTLLYISDFLEILLLNNSEKGTGTPNFLFGLQ